MPRANCNGIQIEYDEFGDAKNAPMLMIMGLGAQMIWWDEKFCRTLADRGFRIIRFDNRDIGKSEWFDHLGAPDLGTMIADAWQGKPINPPYTLMDMTNDAVGLLDAVEINKAHVCGASMGGMIAQMMAIHYPDRLLSLTSIMSTTGNPNAAALSPPPKEVFQPLRPKNRDDFIEKTLKLWQVLAGDHIFFDQSQLREKLGQEYDRGYHPKGLIRQFAAILTSGNRRPDLEKVRLPALVIHGDSDPLVPLAGGKDTADAIPGAELLIIPGMGHFLPPKVWPQIIDAICRVATR
jgi:pimeloyl-ACP methyl ester carboxylesterase